MKLTVGKVWTIPEGSIPNWKENVFFALASDRAHWDAIGHKGRNHFIPGEHWYGRSLETVNEKCNMPIWEEVRLYAIKYLLSRFGPSQPIPKFYRFKNLDLK